MENEAAKINTFKNILKINNTEFSHVLTIEELMTLLINSNPLIKINYEYFTQNFEAKKQILAFKSFINKSVICFQKIPDYSYADFMAMSRSLQEIKINSNVKMYDMLSRAIQELLEREATLAASKNFDKINSVYNYVQMIGKGEVICEKNIVKNYVNRFLINSKNFEILRLSVGDTIFSFFLQFTTLFAFEDKIQNYIQVLGLNLKTKLLTMMGATSMEKYVTGPNSSNLFSQRNTKMSLATSSSNMVLGYDNEKKIIPFQSFEVGRTKIFYCPNFNRKLGFFKSSLKDNKKITKKDNNNLSGNKNNPTKTQTSDFFYSKLFPENYQNLVPIYLENTIREYLSTIHNKMNNFDYIKNFFYYCPIFKDWKERKKNIMTKIKNNCKPEEFNSDLEFLLNTVIDYEKVFKFTICFLEKVIPIEFIGKNNLKVIIKKLKIFIELNRFESFNRISLFDLKEFSFTEMKWLQLKSMKKDTYEIFGIRFKNFIMKNIIYFIYDTLIVQLLRSHFYVTERQGFHYKSFYYHKNVWDLIMKINEIKLGAHFEYITDNNSTTNISKFEKRKKNRELAIGILKSYDLTPGKLRPMPKPTTCRPIVSYKRKTLKTNSILKNDFFETQKVFKYISSKMQSKRENCVVFDHKTIIEKLKNFKLILEALKNEGEDFQEIINELKYCTMDIEACYDNINLEKLNNILDSDDIIPDVFVPHVLFVVLPKPHMLKKVKWVFNRNSKNNFTNYNTNNTLSNNEVSFADCFEVKKLFFASDSNEYLHFLDFLQNKSDLNYSHCIIYQFPEMRSYIRKENFMSRVKAILNNNIIKFNKKFFKQKKGIPQGLSVSSFLCNLYFYNIEKQLAKKINHKINNNLINRNLLLRFMDDYLCITNSENIVHNFLEESGGLASGYNFKFNTKKCKSNLNLNLDQVEVYNSNLSKSFIWNGIYFDINNENFFNILIDPKEEYDIKRFSNLINVNLPIADASWLFKKINGIFLTGHPWIYFIPSINSTQALSKNFVEFCKVVAYKLIILTNCMVKSNIQPGQNSFIDIMDSCLKKLFFYFNNKILRNDNNKFYLEFGDFSKIFYENIYSIYDWGESVNTKLIDFSPYFFKSIRRKMYRLHSKYLSHKDQDDEQMEVDG
jgi:hypothetical protein